MCITSKPRFVYANYTNREALTWVFLCGFFSFVIDVIDRFIVDIKPDSSELITRIFVFGLITMTVHLNATNRIALYRFDKKIICYLDKDDVILQIPEKDRPAFYANNLDHYIPIDPQSLKIK